MEGGNNIFDSPQIDSYRQTEWWRTDMLPESLRHPSGHDNSHTFIIHEFIESIIEKRSPMIGIYEALAMTVPGIIAHRSALRGGKQIEIPRFDPGR
ncbi:MAG: hypothetical protein ACUVQY_03545 [Thermoproteota archaeon]